MRHEVKIGGVLGMLTVNVVTFPAGGRGRDRVELTAYGSRYPYKLDRRAAQALGEMLLAAADRLPLET